MVSLLPRLDLIPWATMIFSAQPPERLTLTRTNTPRPSCLTVPVHEMKTMTPAPLSSKRWSNYEVQARTSVNITAAHFILTDLPFSELQSKAWNGGESLWRQYSRGWGGRISSPGPAEAKWWDLIQNKTNIQLKAEDIAQSTERLPSRNEVPGSIPCTP